MSSSGELTTQEDLSQYGPLAWVVKRTAEYGNGVAGEETIREDLSDSLRISLEMANGVTYTHPDVFVDTQKRKQPGWDPETLVSKMVGVVTLIDRNNLEPTREYDAKFIAAARRLLELYRDPLLWGMGDAIDAVRRLTAQCLLEGVDPAYHTFRQLEIAYNHLQNMLKTQRPKPGQGMGGYIVDMLKALDRQ